MPDTVMTTDPAIAPPRNRSAEIAKLAASLCKAQAAMEGAKKDSENPHFKNAYADLASVWDAVRKPLTDNGLSVVQFPRTAGQGVEIETTLLHTSGEFMSDVLWVPCSKNDAQGLGSAITYGRRYALMSVAGIAPVDDDGNAAVSSHKPGAPGSAGAGPQFRPDRRQMPTQSSAHGRELAASEPDLVDHDRPKGQMPTNGPTNPRVRQAANALEVAKWCKESIEAFKSINTKADLIAWWKGAAEDREKAESAMPAEWDRVIVAYDARMDTVAAKGA